MAEKPLVVIVDEEARKNLKQLSFRWFFNSQKQDDKEWIIETPMGKTREVKGTLVTDHRLGEHTEEYLYLELTTHCHFKCKHCGVGEDVQSEGIKFVTNELGDAEYMTTEFAEKLAATFPDSGRVIPRNVFYGGGEPLIAPARFKDIHSIIGTATRPSPIVKGEVRSTRPHVITNGYSIPLTEDNFMAFLKETNISHGDFIYFSTSDAHQRQYARASELGLASGYVPPVDHPYEALGEKIILLGGLCEKLGIGFRPLVLGDRNGKDLRSYILKKANDDLAKNLIYSMNELELFGSREPCGNGQETSIRFNGDTFPHCYDIFKHTPKVGITGLLIGEK